MRRFFSTLRMYAHHPFYRAILVGWFTVTLSFVSGWFIGFPRCIPYAIFLSIGSIRMAGQVGRYIPDDAVKYWNHVYARRRAARGK